MDKAALRRWVIGDFSWRRLLRSIAIIYIGFGAFAWFVSERLMFHPESSVHRSPAGGILFPSADGNRISAVYRPAANAALTLLFSHGNAEDVGDLEFLFERLNAIGFSVFAWDYRGYGASEGRPTEIAAYRDIDAAYGYLTESLGVPPERIVAYGRSLGGGPSTDLAARAPIGGLILESTFVTVFRVRTVVPLLPFDRFRNIDKIDAVNCPVLIIHGTADRVTPLWHGKALFEQAREPKTALWVDGAAHADVPFSSSKLYEGALLRFAARLQAGADEQYRGQSGIASGKSRADPD